MESSASRPLTPSPKRSPKSSPTRRPLQQRSNSDANVTRAPTIRIVADSGPEVYSKSPFPTLASHILSPRYAPGSLLDSGQGAAVSDEEQPANTLRESHSDETLIPKPLNLRKSYRASTSTTSSDVETITTTSPFLSSSSRFSHATTVSPPSTRESEVEFHSQSVDEKLPALPEEHQTPEQAISPAHARTPEAIKSTIRLVTPSTTNSRAPLANKQSEASLASSTSTDELTSNRPGERGSGSRNWNTFPRSRPPESLDSRSSDSFRAKRASKRPVLYEKESIESLAPSDASYTSGYERPRSASDPSSPSDQARVAAAVRFAVHSGVKVQYPVVRRPSASGSWAKVSNSPSSSATSKNSPSMSEGEGPYIPPRFTSRLSTIPSESERNSNSIDGSDQRTSSASRPWRRRTIGSIISTDFSTSEGSIPIPQPLFGGNRQLPIVQGRESEEGDDTLGELQSPPLRQQRSGFFSRLRPSSSDSLRSQASQISFVGDLSWARNYYRRGETTMQPDLNSSESRLNTATSGNTTSPTSDWFPSAIHRPRNRPRNGDHRRSAAADTLATTVETSSLARFSARNIWSPHLMRDRRNGMAYGPWSAPSMEEPFGSSAFGPVNRQVWLFCLGFILPISWMLAAIVPIPKRPPQPPFAEGVPSAVDIEERMGQVYLQNASVINMTEMEEIRYQKARWWRMLNRIMILPGLIIIGAVTALAVIATRMR